MAVIGSGGIKMDDKTLYLLTPKKINKFNGTTDYDEWKREVASNTAETTDEAFTFRQALTALEGVPKALTTHCKTFKELWSILDPIYKKQDTVEQKLQIIMNINLKDGESLFSFFNRMWNVAIDIALPAELINRKLYYKLHNLANDLLKFKLQTKFGIAGDASPDPVKVLSMLAEEKSTVQCQSTTVGDIDNNKIADMVANKLTMLNSHPQIPNSANNDTLSNRNNILHHQNSDNANSSSYQQTRPRYSHPRIPFRPRFHTYRNYNRVSSPNYFQSSSRNPVPTPSPRQQQRRCYNCGNPHHFYRQCPLKATALN